MEKTGPLKFKNNVPEVDGMQLAIYLAADPFERAKDILQTIGIAEGERIRVRGTSIAGQQVLFMSEVGKVSISAMASGLPGSPVPIPASVKCKDCQHVNTLSWVDLSTPQQCQNPNPPAHSLKLI
jgi:hypothetical protein